MARIRSVKPELRTSEVVASWPFEIRYFFVLLWGYLDDKGRGLDVPKTIAGDCFPHDDQVTPAKVNRWLNIMAATKVSPGKEPPICRYEAGGRRYLHSVNWPEHQKPNRPSPSRLPPCPLHEGLSESRSEPGSDRRSEPPLSPHVLELDSSGAEEFDSGVARSSEPLGERLHAAVDTIAKTTNATPAEAEALARWIDRERKPRNLAGLVNALARGPDLATMLTEQRDRSGRADTAAAIARARQGPACEHGDPGGASPHPVTGEPLCPSCRRGRATWNAPTSAVRAVAKVPQQPADPDADEQP